MTGEPARGGDQEPRWAASATMEVLNPGPLCTLQDRGRPGHAHEGVPPSGAADRPAHDLANRLVGNGPAAATLEVTLGGLLVRYHGPGVRLVAATGAPAPLAVGGRPAPAVSWLRPGDLVELGTPATGLRTYLAVAGGIGARRVLGSASTDLLSGLGPAPLRPGDRLPLGPPPSPPAAADALVASSAEPPGRPVGLRALPGPRADRLDAAGWAQLWGTPWRVGRDSNRVGVRLEGPPLPLAGPGEVPPEGLVTGSVQLPPSGTPVVFLPDHPVTGGYPVVAVVDEADLGRLAQCRPGIVVRFIR